MNTCFEYLQYILIDAFLISYQKHVSWMKTKPKSNRSMHHFCLNCTSYQPFLAIDWNGLEKITLMYRLLKCVQKMRNLGMKNTNYRNSGRQRNEIKTTDTVNKNILKLSCNFFSHLINSCSVFVNPLVSLW